MNHISNHFEMAFFIGPLLRCFIHVCESPYFNYFSLKTQGNLGVDLYIATYSTQIGFFVLTRRVHYWWKSWFDTVTLFVHKTRIELCALIYFIGELCICACKTHTSTFCHDDACSQGTWGCQYFFKTTGWPLGRYLTFCTQIPHCICTGTAKDMLLINIYRW